MWLNAKYEDRERFDEDVKWVCETYEQAQGLREEGVNTISTDEKTGIQKNQMATGLPESTRGLHPLVRTASAPARQHSERRSVGFLASD